MKQLLFALMLVCLVGACGGRNVASSDGGHDAGDSTVKLDGEGDAAPRDLLLGEGQRPDAPGDALLDGPQGDGPQGDGPQGDVAPIDGAQPDQFPRPDLGTPNNATCANAVSVPLTNGRALWTGDTRNAPNEYGTAINCGSTTTTYNGQQRYYKLSLTAGTSYRISIVDQFNNERIYLFRQCGITAINQDCASNGATGTTTTTTAQNEIIFKAPSTGDYILAVDSVGTGNGDAGPFQIAIQSFTPPTNTTCASAATLTLTNGKATASGSTAFSQNEFGTGINCGFTNTTLNSAQLYYKVNMTAGKSYRIDVASQYNNTRFYVFGSSCTLNAINTDCGSGGATGLVSGDIDSTTGTEIFKAPTTGTYTIAVDGTDPNSVGDFSLTVEEFTPPTNGTCAAAQTLTLSGGKVTVSGTTLGTANEFANQIQCNKNFALAGPQVYYKVALTAGKSYRISYTPTFPSRPYLFGDTCTAAQITQQCAQSGIDGDLVDANNTLVRVYSPTTSGTYTFAADSRNNSWFGDFSLTIEEITLPSNGTCATAQTLMLTNGSVSVSGDTTAVPNEFGANMSCGNSSVDGPQLYYDVALAAGKTYKILLTPSYSARFYVFGNGCVANTISQQCGSNGTSGDYETATDIYPRAILFTPSAAGTYKIAVDSSGPNNFGAFTLDISEFTAATNATCAAAKAETAPAVGQTLTISGDTTGVANEYGNGVNCGQFGGFDGGQLYYTLALTAARQYTLSFTPTYSGGRMYLARQTCTAQSIDGDCGSGGTNGDSTGPLYANQTASFNFTPSASATYLLVVDGINPSFYGAFKVEVK